MHSQIDSIVEDLKRALARGDKVSIDEICQHNPELINLVKARFEDFQSASADTVASSQKPELSTAPYSPSGDASVASNAPHTVFPAIAGYRIEAELGRGGMGIVYKATDLLLQRLVAIKLNLTQNKLSTQTRFQTEAAALARLQHPHIVQVFAAGMTGQGQTFFVMEFVEGGSLSDRIGNQPQSIADSVRLVQLLAKAVHGAHQKGIIHRDLKPANILLASPSDEPTLNCAWGTPKIADFGVVKLLDALSSEQQVTSTGDILGTPSYMAPEQARSGKVIGPAVDVYALGAILYKLLAGRPPFQGGTGIDVILKVLEEPPPSLHTVRPDVPAGLAAICERCLKKTANERFETAQALAVALEQFLNELSQKDVAHPSSASVSTQRQDKSKRTKRRPFSVTAIAVLSALCLSCLIGLIVHAWMGRSSTIKTDSVESPLPVTPIPTQPAIDSPAKPAAPPVMVLGKNVNDPDFGSFLQASLDRMISTSNQPVQFSRSYRDLEQVPTRFVSAKLLSYRAECLMEGERKNLPQASELIKQANELNTPNAYTRYVQARVWHELGDPQQAVNALDESLKRDHSLTGFRRERALSIFEEAAQRISMATDAQALTCRLVDPPGWLTTAERFVGKDVGTSTLALVLAVHQPAADDPARLSIILTDAMLNEWTKKPQGPVVVTSLRLKQAQAAATAKQPALALSLYCDCWNYVIAHRGAFDATSPLTLNSRILTPAQRVAAEVKPNPERNTQFASILAAYGGLIFESPYEDWPRPADQPALRLAAEAYATAARIYPKEGRTRAEYLTGQGRCLNRLGSLVPNDIAVITANAKVATTEAPTFAGSWNLMGLARYYGVVDATSEGDIRKTLNESIEAYDKAIRLAEQANPQDREIAQYFSNRSLAKSMLGDFTPVENNERRNAYEKAIEDALKATNVDSQNETAWEALGQAHERLANLINGNGSQFSFEEAIKAYQKMIDTRPAFSKGHVYLGRCFIRWGLVENNDLTKLNKGRDALIKVINTDNGVSGVFFWLEQNELNPEAHFWLGRYYLARNDHEKAIVSFLAACKHPDLGRNYLSNTISLQQTHPMLLLKFLDQYLPTNLAQADAGHAKGLVLRSQLLRQSLKNDTAREQAEPVLDKAITDAQLALRLTPAADIKQRAEAMEAIAGARLAYFMKTKEDKDRSALIDDIRELLKAKYITRDAWFLAAVLALRLNEDAADATNNKAKELLQEAVKAADFAIANAPPDKKESCRNIRNDIMKKLQ